MKIWRIMTVCVTVISVNISLAQSNITINSTIRSQIANILKNKREVFKLDINENQRNFMRIDNYFREYINLDESIKKQHKDGQGLSFKCQYEKNIPILPTNKKIKVLMPDEPFDIWYTQGPQIRSFTKVLDVPTKLSLPKKDVIEIASDFLFDNKFCKITEMDILSSPIISSLKRHELKPNIREDEKLTMLHRVEFKREFSGIEVINSKQIVEIHPETHEILSYKNINWTPVNEEKGRTMQYYTLKEILSRIDSSFIESKDKYKVSKVKAGMFQTDKIIFPVLAIYTELKSNGYESRPIKQVLVINLVKDLEIEKEKKELKYPKKVKF